MKRPYKHVRLKQGSEEWIKWRHETGIGGSEVASALATNSKELAELVYCTPIQLFLQKIAEPVTRFSGNASSFEGQLQEPSIINRFKYFDLERPDQLDIYKNMEKGIKINGVYAPKDVVYNPEYPWLYVSEDAFMTEAVKSRMPIALLEAKMTTSMEASRYRDGINPAHFIQLMTGLMITGLPVGYLITMTDGKWFKVTKVLPDASIFEWIRDTTYTFWRNVLEARKIKLQYDIQAYFNINPDLFTEKQLEGVQLLRELEPEVIGSDNELKFFKDMIIPQAEEIPRPGSEEELNFVQNYLQANQKIDQVATEKTIWQSKMLNSLNGCNMITFDEFVKGSYYSYKPDKNGRLSLHVSAKLKNA